MKIPRTINPSDVPARPLYPTPSTDNSLSGDDPSEDDVTIVDESDESVSDSSSDVEVGRGGRTSLLSTARYKYFGRNGQAYVPNTLGIERRVRARNSAEDLAAEKNQWKRKATVISMADSESWPSVDERATKKPRVTPHM